MTDLRSTWRNSIGSSIVTMCFATRALMWSMIAASVVDLPEPVVPVSRMIPRSSSASSPMTGGRARSEIVRIEWGIARQTRLSEPRWRKALTRKRAMPVIEYEKSTSCSRASSSSFDRVVQHHVHGGLGVFGSQRRLPLDRPQLTVDASQRRGLNLQMEVGASELHQGAESIVDVEHAPRIGR